MKHQDAYPKNFEEFLDWFSTEELCRGYLESIKWPDGFVCPQCNSKEAWKTDRGLWHCRDCNHQTSVTAGTVFEDTRMQKGVTKRFQVINLTIVRSPLGKSYHLKD